MHTWFSQYTSHPLHGFHNPDPDFTTDPMSHLRRLQNQLASSLNQRVPMLFYPTKPLVQPAVGYIGCITIYRGSTFDMIGIGTGLPFSHRLLQPQLIPSLHMQSPSLAIDGLIPKYPPTSVVVHRGSDTDPDHVPRPISPVIQNKRPLVSISSPPATPTVIVQPPTTPDVIVQPPATPTVLARSQANPTISEQPTVVTLTISEQPPALRDVTYQHQPTLQATADELIRRSPQQKKSYWQPLT